MKKLFLIFFFLFALTEMFAGNREDTLEIINIKSSINGGFYQLYIRTPENYQHQQKNPAILLLDANYYHRTFVNLYDSVVSAEADDQVIIGIGYLPNPMNDTLFMRDFTPGFIEDYPNSGRATEFKQILERELIPIVLKNYSIDESRISIVGHHYSALFLTWLLTQEPPQFSSYVICSPVLTFNNSFTDFKINKSNTGIYLSMGSGKILFVDDPKLNKEKFNTMTKSLNNNYSGQIKTSQFGSTLRYDDLYQGFAEGIKYILTNAENKGNRKNSSISSDIIISRSEIIIDQVSDANTSNPYELSIYIPENVSEKKLPLVVILDADFNYTELLYASQQLMNENSIPKSIVVGVGYGTSIIGKGNYRNRDLLPRKIQNMESGNGDNFAVFLNRQLIDYLAQYPIDTSEMTLQGHSYGGLFLTYLLTRDDLVYQNLIISSPAIWQDKTVLRKLKEPDNSITQKIFIASGKLNDNDKDAKRLDKVLGHKNANLKTVLYPNDSHLTVITKAFKDGLLFFMN
jgi:predicted alpha/beta superfamily hydrolase